MGPHGDHRGRVAFPFCDRTLTAPIPPSPAYPTGLVTVGNHLRARRLDLGLVQREVATEIGVSAGTLYNWEVNRCEPEVRYWPGIVRFLGYDPSPEPTTFGERVAAKRRSLGLARKRLAQQLGVDEASVRRIECDEVRSRGKLSRGKLWRVFTAFLAY